MTGYWPWYCWLHANRKSFIDENDYWCLQCILQEKVYSDSQSHSGMIGRISLGLDGYMSWETFVWSFFTDIVKTSSYWGKPLKKFFSHFSWGSQQASQYFEPPKWEPTGISIQNFQDSVKPLKRLPSTHPLKKVIFDGCLCISSQGAYNSSLKVFLHLIILKV